ncbi:MAG: T9SS type A sorting domain-containing protein [bacterium]|nr:T9SS type A sorting domain-containing protein [Candidatus Limimorpha caballi]
MQSGFGSIDISGLATGMYIMKVTLDDGKVFEEKIVKQ